VETPNFLLTVWGYALAGATFLVFALTLLRLRYLWAPGRVPTGLMAGAVAASTLWSGLVLTSLLNNSAVLLRASALADWLRYACWIAFLLLLGQGASQRSRLRELGASGAIAAVTLAVFLAVQVWAMTGWRGSEAAGQWVLIGAMALPLLALFLLEQMYRDVPEEVRWSIKPLCLGLAGTFLFDLYVFSQAVLFSRIDLDAMSICCGCP
jgi:hypothetical protein